MSELQRIGAINGGSGNASPFTAEQSGASRVADAHGRYVDAVRNGNVYALSARNMTNAAGQGYAQAAAATVNFVFWNPLTSGVLLALYKFSFVTLSGTPAAGEINYQISAGNSITSTANGTHVNAFTGSIAGSKAKSWVKTAAAAIAGTAAFNDLRPAFASSATAAGLNYAAVAADPLEGEIILQPGMAFTYGTGGAGTTWVVSAGLLWEELPLLT